MIDILLETGDYIVVNKPSGLITEINRYEDSLEKRVLDHLGSVSEKKIFLGVVHRLDKVTSGLVLFAKKKSSLRYFNSLFEKKRIRKTYLAIVSGCPGTEEAKLSHFLEVDKRNKKAIIHTSKKEDVKPCSLYYKVKDKINNYCLIQIKPQSGRFHQIRAQLSFIGHPIVGDIKYGSRENYHKGQVCLHAYSLRFRDFNSEKDIVVQAPAPLTGPWLKFKK